MSLYNICIFFMYTSDMDILDACDMFYVVFYLCQMVIDDLGAWCRREGSSICLYFLAERMMNYLSKSKRLRCSWKVQAFITVLMA